jgi:hypothetical protein
MIFKNSCEYHDGFKPIIEYGMNHNDPAQRRVLGEQCRNAFEGGQVVVTVPMNS